MASRADLFLFLPLKLDAGAQWNLNNKWPFRLKTAAAAVPSTAAVAVVAAAAVVVVVIVAVPSIAAAKHSLQAHSEVTTDGCTFFAFSIADRHMFTTRRLSPFPHLLLLLLSRSHLRCTTLKTPSSTACIRSATTAAELEPRSAARNEAARDSFTFVAPSHTDAQCNLARVCSVTCTQSLKQRLQQAMQGLVELVVELVVEREVVHLLNTSPSQCCLQEQVLIRFLPQQTSFHSLYKE